MHRIARKTFLTISSLAVIAWAASCSGSGGSSGESRSGMPSTLLIDTGTTNGESMRGTLEVVTLETGSGAMTPNLLTEPRTVTLSDPTGRVVGVPLAAIPTGSFIAVHLLFAADSLRARRSNGTEVAVAQSRRDLKIWFEDLAWSGSSWLMLRHRSDSSLQEDTSGKLRWLPSMSARPASTLPLRDCEVEIAQLDDSTQRALGFLIRTAEMPVTLSFDPDCKLLRDASLYSKDDFWQGLGVGSRLHCDGVLDDRGGLRISSADDRGKRSSTRSENEVLARILSIDAAGRSLRAQVLQLRYGTSSLPRSPMPVVDVLAGNARIHRSGLRHVPLDFSALRANQLVEIEWYGSAYTPIVAHEIEIEDEVGGHVGPEIEGAIASVDTDAASLTVIPRKDDPLVVGGRAVSSALIRVTPSTSIVRKTDDGRVAIELAAITTSDRVWVRGRVVAQGVVEASWIRVRDDSR